MARSRPGQAFDALRREPVYLGTAVLASVAIANPSPPVMAAAVAWVGWAVRMASRSKISADEDAEIARWTGAVEEAARRAR